MLHLLHHAGFYSLHLFLLYCMFPQAQSANCAIFKMSTQQVFIQQQEDDLYCIHIAFPDDPKHFVSFLYGRFFIH